MPASPLRPCLHHRKLTTSCVGCVQANKDFVPILERLSNEERLTLLHLVSDHGIIQGQIQEALALLLDPFLTSKYDAAGNSVICLNAPWHAPLIQVISSIAGFAMMMSSYGLHVFSAICRILKTLSWAS